MLRSRPLLRLVYTVLIVTGIVVAATGSQALAGTFAQTTSMDYEWSRSQTNPTEIRISPTRDTTAVISGFTLRNNSTLTTTTYLIDVPDHPSGWKTDLSITRVTLTPGSSFTGISVRLTIPPNSPQGNQNMTVTATKLGENGLPVVSASLFVLLAVVIDLTPVPTSQLPLGCPEVSDPGNNYESAKLIRVNFEEAHGICQTGDEDWFKFAAVGGKIYTIDITQMDLGLDLALELYDDRRNRLTSNDDYYDRPPSSGTPSPGYKDTKPRINSWRAPRDGTYVVRVRDTLGIGGNNLTYHFMVSGESYGPTPTMIPEICNDAFEPDGLPEIARMIFSNETQVGRRFCPTGDADWVRFFGLAGRLYIIYTDTRPYTTTEGGPEPGADTILILTDRDGTRILDINNDMPGGDTLDSEIQFRPVIDGFYYVQVKNIGDIGSQFIKYDLTVRACPGQYCRPNPPGQAPAPTAKPATG